MTITGRCYCGSIRFETNQRPQAIAYCHCDDCRRATGGPVAAFAAFAPDGVSFQPGQGKLVNLKPGVTRTFCPDCGSSLTGQYDYLPDQIYICMGVIDQANDLAPQIHAHESERLDWLCIDDKLDRTAHTASSKLVASQPVDETGV